MSKTVLTPMFRGSYLNLFTSKPNTLKKTAEFPGGVPQFSCQALFPFDIKSPELAGMKAAAEAAAIENWGPDKTKWPKNMRSPFRDQSEREKEGVLPEGCKPGNVFCTFSTNDRAGQPGPAVFDQQNQRITAMDQTKVYSGCWLKAQVTAYAYPKKGVQGQTPGITFFLNAVQLVKDDTPLGNRPNVENAFAPIEGAAISGDGAGSMFDSMA